MQSLGLTLIAWLAALPSALAFVGTPSSTRHQPLAFAPSHHHRQRRHVSHTHLYENRSDNNNNKNPLSFLSPYEESKIPPELKDEIFRAEANTAASKDRGFRIALYTLVAITGILCAFGNGFLTEVRSHGGDLTEEGFGWIVDNFLWSFIFTNKIGGAICLLGGGGAGLLAEAEIDTKRINAEKIYEEMVRRREAKEASPAKTKAKKGSSKKRRPGKESKRMEALSEVVVSEKKKELTLDEEVSAAVTETTAVSSTITESTQGNGIFGAVKDMYEKADNMAASQALLLNKSLEDAGVVEKITDETGLKVIGKEEAAKLKEKKQTTED